MHRVPPVSGTTTTMCVCVTMDVCVCACMCVLLCVGVYVAVVHLNSKLLGKCLNTRLIHAAAASSVCMVYLKYIDYKPSVYLCLLKLHVCAVRHPWVSLNILKLAVAHLKKKRID